MRSVIYGTLGAAIGMLLSAIIARGADLPTPEQTYGVVEPRLTKEHICAPDFGTKAWRHVSAGRKAAVYRAYGMAKDQGECATGRGCEVDHLIPLELGGSNDIHNLWPQPYETHPWNASLKDDLENELHRLVCGGAISLEEAQTEIRTNWIVSWQRRFGLKLPPGTIVRAHD